MAENKVVINETVNKLVVNTPGPQGPRGKTILNGIGAPANNLGFVGDFYYNTSTTQFYGPKLSDTTWAGSSIITLAQEVAFAFSWEVAQLIGNPPGPYSIPISHNLEFFPNVVVKSSSGDILETDIAYNSTNQITLIMAQPFSGTAYLS